MTLSLWKEQIPPDTLVYSWLFATSYREFPSSRMDKAVQDCIKTVPMTYLKSRTFYFAEINKSEELGGMIQRIGKYGNIV